jgi:zona occludens toxin (predicted ATPase)
MSRINKILILLAALVMISLKSYAVCDFTVSKTTVCAGEEVTITLAQPLATYHNIIIYNGVFPFWF